MWAGINSVRPKRGSVSCVRSLRRATGQMCEGLEPRVLLSFDPSAQEQYMFQLVNRFRQNPVSELSYFVNSFGTPAGSAYANISSALQQFGVSGAELQKEFAALTAAPPLAWNSILYGTATAHTKLQIQYDTQSHQITQAGEADLGTRVTNAGYQWSAVGENVYSYAYNVFYGQAGFVIDWGTGDTGQSVGGIQSPPGHRQNLLDPDYTSVGISILPSSGPMTGPLVITQDFGGPLNFTSSSIVGAVFQDVNGNNFYDPGEGLGGVSISVVGTNGTRGTFTTQSLTAGGWQLQVPNGTYNVTFSGAGFGNPVTYSNIAVNGQNVELDAVKGYVPPAPKAAVYGNGLAIAAGDTSPTSADATGFGGANISGQNVSHTFTLTNNGSVNMSIYRTGTRVGISGANAADFTLVQDLGTNLLTPGQSATFIIRFNPSALGYRTATVSISTNDPANGTYTFTIQGRGIDRGVAQLSGLSQPIVNGQAAASATNGTTFGGVLAPGAYVDRVFTVTNTGAGVLNLLGVNPITISGPGASSFRVIGSPSLTAINQGGSATFTIRFAPKAVGAIKATVYVATSDALNASYSFVIRGTGVAAPQLQVVNALGVVIPNGASSPSVAQQTGFGQVAVGAGRPRTYTILNNGLANLVLTSPFSVTLSGPDASEFRLPAQPSILRLGPGGTVSFVIRLRPVMTGTFNATVTITSNDPFVGSYSFAIRGVGV